MPLITPVILCGGSGTRLWPRSRAAKPKPFLPLVGEQTLFEQAISRCGDPAIFAPPCIVTGSRYVRHVAAQLGAASGASIIVEPSSRNTAAAIALAACRLPEDTIMLVCPSDHHIGNPSAFVAAARNAACLAEDGWLVAFGIEAKSPETGFGYLCQGESVARKGFRVERFVEKPDLETAKSFVADGGCAWNGGIFAFTAGTLMTELTRHRPHIARAVRIATERGREEGGLFHPDADAFNRIDGESIDYAVMEATLYAAMVRVEMDWSDIGNWPALHAARPLDPAGNSVTGAAELVDCRNVLIQSDGPRVSVIGMEGVIVVVDGDDVLVVAASAAQKVGKLHGAANQ